MKVIRKQALQLGGEDGILRQTMSGKLTVRERIDLLLDVGTFKEIGSLSGKGFSTDVSIK